MSGAERLPNGDTLVCSGTHGTVLEVTTKGEVVWQYVYSDNVFPRPPARPDDPGMRHFQQRPDFAGFRPGGAAPPGLGVGPPLYRAPRYGSGYPGLRGKALVAGKKVEESDTESVPALP
jgi:hypothetical protein